MRDDAYSVPFVCCGVTMVAATSTSNTYMPQTRALTTPTSDPGRVQVFRSVLGVCTLVSQQTCYSANRIYDQLDWLVPVLYEGLWSSRIIVVIGEEFEHLQEGWSSVVIIDCTEYVSTSQRSLVYHP